MQPFQHFGIYTADLTNPIGKQQAIQVNETTSEDESSPAAAKTVATSIDDFLANYKHERVAIFEFLSSLDDVSTTSLHTIQSHSPYADNHQAEFPMAKAAVNSSLIASCVKLALSCKQTSECQALELRDEQRRIKNREYQRRFRERRRKLQKHSSSAPAQQYK